MTRLPTVTIAAARCLSAAVAYAIAATLFAACSTAPRRDADPISQLESLAERQAHRPDRSVMDAPPPPGVDPILLEPVDAASADARATLDEVTERLAAQFEPPEASPPPADEALPPPSEEDSIRAYVSARARRFSGDLTSAVRDLEAAAMLAPDAEAPWRELGETYLAAGDRISALAAFREAVARDPWSIRALERYGLAALDRREHDVAAGALSRVWLRMDDADPGLRPVVARGLGRSLLELGYVSAGAEGLQIAATAPERLSGPTIRGAELSEVLRERGEILREAGDAAMRLGEPERAAQAYALAANFPTFDPGALAPRRVYAALRLGRPAEAAAVIVREIESSRGQVEDRQLRLIEHLSRYTDVGPRLSAAIDAVAKKLSEQDRRLAATRLARARAAALDQAQAVEVLRARLAVAPADDAVIIDLYRRLSPAPPDRLLAVTADLIAAAPLEMERYGAALLRTGIPAEELLAAADEAPPAQKESLEWSLMRAHLLVAAGRPRDAEQALRALAEARPDSAPVAVALARRLVHSGRAEEAAALIERLDATDDPQVLLARAMVLQSIGRHEEALAALNPLIRAAEPRPEALLRAAQSAIALQRWREAERWCKDALDVDPSLEDAHAVLIGLYAPSGPLADPRRLGDAVRDLRVAIPSSRTLRWLRAQDLVRAGQLDQAERELLGLAEEEPSDAVVNTLVTIWIRGASYDRAEQWLREKADARPGDSTMHFQMARVLDAAGRSEEAVEILREWLDEHPEDDTASRLLEAGLASLGRDDEADALALARLSRPDAPVTLERAVERAEIMLRRGEYNAALDAVLNSGARPGPLPQDRAVGLARIAQEAGRRAAASPQDIDLTRARDILDLAVRVLPRTPAPLHNDLLRVLVATDAPSRRLAEAVTLAAEQHPELAAEFFLQTSQYLINGERVADALPVAERGATTVKPPDPRLFGQWIALAGDPSVLDLDGVMRAITATRDAGMATAAFATLIRGRPSPESENDAAATLAYLLAGGFASATPPRDADADRLYRFALRFKPDHAMAINNLAYRMIERGEDIPEAARMLETAYANQPNDANVVDSLAWARYKLGVLEDEVSEQGEVLREGAVTLLRRAARLAEDEESGYGRAVIFDHLGDALWRTGHAEEARTQWDMAGALMQGVISNADRRLDELRAVVDSIEAKLDAVSDGREPPVAPLDPGAKAPAPQPATALEAPRNNS